VSSRLFLDVGEIFRDLLPVVYANEARRSQVVWGRIEQALAFKTLQVAGQIVDQVVGTQDALVSAENIVSGRNEREVPLQSAVFWAE